MKLVILAGGKGTRLGLKKIPKPMVDFCGTPLLLHQIKLAKKYGINEIYLLVGFLSNKIVEYFGDGSKFGVKINYFKESVPLGTSGSVKQIESELFGERFMVFYGDTFIDVNLKRMIDYDNSKKNSIGTILTHPNDHPHDSDLVEVGTDGLVTNFYSKPRVDNKYYRNVVNAALYIFSYKIFDKIKFNHFSDFGKDIFPKIIKEHNLYSYSSTEYIKDIGTPSRYNSVLKDFKNGKTKLLNYRFKQKAIFLDRDGVINKEVDELVQIQDFELICNVTRAIKKINDSNFLSIIITNQPMIAKGKMSFADLNNIHKKMDYLLGKKNVYVDDLFFCPHHPEKGFQGEIKSLKINCNCRKPDNGMLLEASKKHNIDFSKSWFIGDLYSDISAGIKSGVRTILLKTGHAGRDKEKYKNIHPDYIFRNLSDAINFILKNDN